MRKYQKEFKQFLSETKLLNDAEKTVYEMSDEFSNIVMLSGEVLGEDTLDKIKNIGKKYDLLAMTNGLSVMYRNPRPPFTVE